MTVKKQRHKTIFLGALAVVIAFVMTTLVVTAMENTSLETRRRTGGMAVETDCIEPRPIEAEFFPTAPAVINGWIHDPAGPDIAKIRSHGWDLWGAITEPSDQIVDGELLPIWETWYSRFEVFSQFDAPEHCDRLHLERRELHNPNQVVHAGLDDDIRLLSGVKYNEAAAEHVWKYGYNDPQTLNDLNDSFNETSAPVADRKIVNFPARAVTLKPTYWIVKQTGLTLLPVWTGPLGSTWPDQPQADTWTTFVAVDPDGKQVGQIVTGSISRTIEGGQETVISYSAKVVSLDQFYAVALTDPDEIDFLTTNNPKFNPIVNTTEGEQPVELGDFAVLVGMHVTTREIDNWTWQTFWWTPEWQNDPLAYDKPNTVTGVWQNYAMRTAYFMVTPVDNPVGQPFIGFNPYLETDLGPQGKVSNCMSCHQSAVWPAPENLYPFFNGHIDPEYEPYFGEVTKVDLLWSVVFGAQANE